MQIYMNWYHKTMTSIPVNEIINEFLCKKIKIPDVLFYIEWVLFILIITY